MSALSSQPILKGELRLQFPFHTLFSNSVYAPDFYLISSLSSNHFLSYFIVHENPCYRWFRKLNHRMSFDDSFLSSFVCLFHLFIIFEYLWNISFYSSWSLNYVISIHKERVFMRREREKKVCSMGNNFLITIRVPNY